MTHNHGLTFVVPAGSSYCPLPQDWVGSDHGTTLFLERPKACDGAGYPSGSGHFLPAATPRIEVFYSYWMDEWEPKPPPCNVEGWTNLLGYRRKICRGRLGGLITEEVTAKYTFDADSQVADSQVIVTLFTTPERQEKDLIALLVVTSSLQSCADKSDDSKTTARQVGRRRACPAAGWF